MIHVCRVVDQATAFRGRSPLGRVAGHAQFVVVGVAEIGAVIVLVILGTQARRPFAGAALGKRGLVGLVYKRSTGGQEGDHLAVSGLVRVLVVRPADEKQRSVFAGFLPAGPR